MIRKALRTFAWIAAGAVAFVVVVYLIAIAVNWRDREASATATRLDTLYHDRPAVADRDNAFVYAMGLEVSPGEDPQAMGLKRVAWLQQWKNTAHSPTAPDPLGKATDYRASRNPTTKAFLEACGPFGTGCATAFDTSDEVFDEWLAAESWLLERYRTLIARTGWRETVDFNVEAPLPSYGPMVDGQKLLLLKARRLAQQGDHAGARELLEADMRFWRRVLESSDFLITKMFATAAISRSFEWGNLIVRRLQPADVSKVVPETWKNALTDAERSMQRSLVGEWKFVSSMIRETPVDLYTDYGDEVAFGTKVAEWFLMPMFQRQDSLNAYADNHSSIIERLKVPLDQYAAATTDIDRLAQRMADDALPPTSLYNLTGKFVLSLGVSDFGAYARRVADLEGVRRAVLTAAALHESNVKASDVAAALASTTLRNPYTGQPFVWDAKEKAIVFQGLWLDERGRHSVPYALE